MTDSGLGGRILASIDRLDGDSEYYSTIEGSLSKDA